MTVFILTAAPAWAHHSVAGYDAKQTPKLSGTVKAISLEESPCRSDGEATGTGLWLYMGTSNGKWEGNTLVVNTINLKEETLLDASGLPNNGELRVNERYSLQANGKQLKNVITIEDSANYTRTWQTRVPF